MEDKLIKENDTHVWRETEHGIGYVYPKNVFWVLLEQKAEKQIEFEKQYGREYLNTLMKIYGQNHDNDPPKNKEASEPS